MRTLSSQLPLQRSSDLVTARPEEQLAENSPILKSLPSRIALDTEPPDSIAPGTMPVNCPSIAALKAGVYPVCELDYPIHALRPVT